MSVRLASDAFAGFGGGPGAGGSAVNVAVHGGRYGVWFVESEGNPVLGGAVLYGQSESALYWAGQGPLILTGVHIVQAPGATGPAIRATEPISIIDTVIECDGSLNRSLAISTAASLYTKNVYIRDCATLVAAPTATSLYLYLVAYNATDPSQQFAGKALVQPGAISSISNRGTGLCLCLTVSAIIQCALVSVARPRNSHSPPRSKSSRWLPATGRRNASTQTVG